MARTTISIIAAVWLLAATQITASPIATTGDASAVSSNPASLEEIIQALGAAGVMANGALYPTADSSQQREEAEIVASDIAARVSNANNAAIPGDYQYPVAQVTPAIPAAPVNNLVRVNVDEAVENSDNENGSDSDSDSGSGSGSDSGSGSGSDSDSEEDSADAVDSSSASAESSSVSDQASSNFERQEAETIGFVSDQSSPSSTAVATASESDTAKSLSIENVSSVETSGSEEQSAESSSSATKEENSDDKDSDNESDSDEDSDSDDASEKDNKRESGEESENEDSEDKFRMAAAATDNTNSEMEASTPATTPLSDAVSASASNLEWEAQTSSPVRVAADNKGESEDKVVNSNSADSGSDSDSGSGSGSDSDSDKDSDSEDEYVAASSTKSIESSSTGTPVAKETMDIDSDKLEKEAGKALSETAAESFQQAADFVTAQVESFEAETASDEFTDESELGSGLARDATNDEAGSDDNSDASDGIYEFETDSGAESDGEEAESTNLKLSEESPDLDVVMNN
ncbi:hypothetical protein COEREDRAFT_6009 [Coemansia reversa NRRL 1564]|uniref:Dentin sialophosphoprotein n=1 Tax=Coemansia reversa (strain ATCC 12441 / NRRL 1564) TaxID=763665 RepID=A0A2G5BII4_COERN|nr:hypothetical protein COEREDRAFT_6009 [Coemansia reversa NRRL 1564]|eukprot:PIA18828.1 hypothetical protein COEREDRAFT_6009 [Coemansia reversa NRRL 1564]